ncbi:glucose-6-phosphate 1-epimerase [Marinobacter daqiaonensis]|uniref:Putative glucose-6-phosphate 1-epimerase n=1 Tax=Marinobacter daqiaonensis TaxID=650891 RepID=A0A1I6GX87_9GAMM|nr:D-hexose-6-phosphate mutarotase [Marinobacter daqiaonensis]SFR46873.1 glucose-6-phosphate 1-epimerase [Marinobacter daqiaonensis]
MQQDVAGSRFTSLITEGELDALDIRHPDFHATVFLQGAHLTRFCPTGEENWLWMSDEVRLEKGRAIRGGIPVCWPWFGDPVRNESPVRDRVATDLPHGFARTSPWALQAIEETDRTVTLNLKLDTSPEPATLPWRGQAEATIGFRFSRSTLSIDLATRNTGADPLAISQALHTYLPTTEIQRSRILGLEHCDYLDTLDDWRKIMQRGDVTFAGETDRIYLAAPDLDILTPTHRYHLTARGSGSTVVWNPGPEKAARLSAFPDNAWRTMLCVETANAATDYRSLDSGQTRSLGLTLTRTDGGQ